jgi:hypothetical protein
VAIVLNYGSAHLLSFCPFLFLIFVKNCLEYLFCLFFTLIEAIVISAHDNYPKVDSKVPYIDVQNELLADPRNTNRSPSFSSVFHAWVCINVVHEDLDVLGFDLTDLLWISKDRYRIKSTYKHTTSKSLGQVRLNAFLNYSSD